jgi:serine/threonine protein kinase
MSLAPGYRLAQYEILEPIGAGGMGEVYRARDSRLDRDVAIKVMSPAVASDPEMRRRFETEARAIAALSHSAIVGIHELAVVNDVPVAVMELLQGETLRTRLKAGPLTWRETVHIASTMADGLAAAHARGIIHRDLKPENVFLTSDGAVKILDFGLALQRDILPTEQGPTIIHTAPHVVMGTFGYMSPEQVSGARVDARSDIFALGCLIYEMASGRPRFAGNTAQEIIAQLLNESTPDLTVLDVLQPRELRTIVSRCTERVPSRRFESASDVAMALRALLTGSAAEVLDNPQRMKPRGKSLAVLPFVNAGADPSIEFLTNAITENIINSLSQLRGLRVVPRSLVFRYKGLQSDPSTIGLALNARTILTGRVSQQGDTLIIQAELVDTSTESQLWGEQFRLKLTELANVQQEIAWQISEALRLKLTTAQKRKLRKRAAVDPVAYQEYLRGRHFFGLWTAEGFRRALEHFDKAIDQDPTYAPAYAGLGDVIGSMSYYGFFAPEDGFPRAQAAAEKALSLDPDLAEAHATLALGSLFYQWKWDQAEQHFKDSIRLNPKLATVRAFYAIFLASAGRHEEAIAEARIGRQLDPLSPLVNMSVGWALYFSGRLDETITELVRTRDLLPTDSREELDSALIIAYELVGRFEEAGRLAGSSRCFGVTLDTNALMQAWREGGIQGYWRERLASVERATPTAMPMIHFSYGVVLAQLGRFDDALGHLETLVNLRSGGPVFFAVDPALAPLRGHAGFEALVDRIGTPRQPAASAR